MCIFRAFLRFLTEILVHIRMVTLKQRKRGELHDSETDFFSAVRKT